MWSKWYLIESDGQPVIRRYTKRDGKVKWERYPKDKYRNITRSELENFMRRINITAALKRAEAEERYNFDHSFVTKEKLNEFEAMLLNRANNQAHITRTLTYLKKHVLHYFILEKKLPHPNFWIKHEEEWGRYLMKKKLSANTLKQIVQAANRLLLFLRRKNSEEIQAIRLEPFSSKKLQHMKAVSKFAVRRKLISDEDVQVMINNCRPELKSYILLAYKFGLRRAEILGLSPDHVLKGALSVTRQVVDVNPIIKYGPLKSKQVRKVPYWQSSPKEAYELIKDLAVIHPSTLSDMFSALMAELKMPFQLHDFRRTFITKALRANHWRDVQLAAGHYDIKTTIGYAQDDRTIDDEKWTPDDA
jgi:integrase